MPEQPRPQRFRPSARPLPQGTQGGVRGRVGGVPSPAPQASSKLDTLAKGLGTFSQALQGYAQRVGKERAEELKDQEDQFAADLSRMEGEELEKFYFEKRTGLSGREQAALDRQFAVRKAREASRSVTRRIAEGRVDPARDDLAALFAEERQAAFEQYQSQEFQETYDLATQESIQQARNLSTQERGEAVREQLEQGVFDMMRTTVDDMRGASTDAVLEALTDIRNAHGPDSDANMSWERLDALTLSVAARAAGEGRVGLVNTLLRSSKLRNGKPALANVKKYQETTQGILKTAEQEAESAYREANYSRMVDLRVAVGRGEVSPEEIREEHMGFLQEMGVSERGVASLMGTAERAQQAREEEARAAVVAEQERTVRASLAQADAQALVRGEPLRFTQPYEAELADGSTVTVSPEERKEAAVTTFVENQTSHLRAELEGVDPNQNPEEYMRAERQYWGEVMSVLAKNDITEYQPVKAVLQAGEGVARRGQPDAPETRRGLALWRQANAVSRTFARELAGERAADFYEAVDAQERSVHPGNTEAAIQDVVGARQDPSILQEFDGMSRFDFRDEVNDKIKEMFKDTKAPFTTWLRDEFPKDSGAMAEVRQMARSYVRAGVRDPAVAIESALERYQETHRFVGGIPVPKPSYNSNVPRNFEQASTALFDAARGQVDGMEDANPAEMVVVPDRDGNRYTLMVDGAPAAPGETIAVGDREITLPYLSAEDMRHVSEYIAPEGVDVGSLEGTRQRQRNRATRELSDLAEETEQPSGVEGYVNSERAAQALSTMSDQTVRSMIRRLRSNPEKHSWTGTVLEVYLKEARKRGMSLE